MFKSGLIDTPSRAIYKITDEGRKVLKKNPDKIDLKFLEQFEGYLAFKGSKREKKELSSEPQIESKLTPDEIVRESIC